MTAFHWNTEAGAFGRKFVLMIGGVRSGTIEKGADGRWLAVPVRGDSCWFRNDQVDDGLTYVEDRSAPRAKKESAA